MKKSKTTEVKTMNVGSMMLDYIKHRLSQLNDNQCFTEADELAVKLKGAIEMYNAMTNSNYQLKYDFDNYTYELVTE